MPRQREVMVGSRSQFAVKLAFLPDPDQGASATKEESLSWGSLEIWANGHNICRHIEQGESVDAVHWYLIPILRWFSSNWDFLLHEERLPVRNTARDAWLAMQRTIDPPAALSDAEAEQWEVSWQNWWKRHSLVAAREGGLVPNLFIRRWRDLIELSWGDRALAGAPNGFQFDAIYGQARFRAEDVAEVLYGVLDDASNHLVNEAPESDLFAEFRRDIERIKSADRRRRLGLVSGFRSGDLPPEEGWRQIERLFPANLDPEVSEAVFGVQADQLVITGAPQAALMFGSLAPEIDEADVQVLAQKLIDFYDQHGDSDKLRPLVKNVPVQRSDEQAWQQGYQLAEDCREALGAMFNSQRPIAVEGIFEHLGITVEEIALHDQTVRAVALAGPKHKPAVLVNGNFAYQRVQPRRFTLAHELCHILHDRSYGARLALASGPWAPIDVEKRANAFAAMLLMPADQVGTVVSGLTQTLNSSSAIWEVANAFQTSFSATLEHLYNLGHIDEVLRDALRDEIENKAALANGAVPD